MKAVSLEPKLTTITNRRYYGNSQKVSTPNNQIKILPVANQSVNLNEKEKILFSSLIKDAFFRNNDEKSSIEFNDKSLNNQVKKNYLLGFSRIISLFSEKDQEIINCFENIQNIILMSVDLNLKENREFFKEFMFLKNDNILDNGHFLFDCFMSVKNYNIPHLTNSWESLFKNEMFNISKISQLENVSGIRDIEPISVFLETKIKCFPNLKVLELKNLQITENFLKSLIVGLKEPEKLQELDISYNCIKVLPIEIGSLTSLKSLNLEFLMLRKLPKSFGNLCSLTELNIRKNLIGKEFPTLLNNFKELTNLVIDCTFSTGFPVFITKLKKLQHLDLNLNSFDCIPPEIENQLKNLKSLKIAKKDSKPKNFDVESSQEEFN